MSRAPVSAAIIAKNAARELEACLQSIAWVDEIVLLDSGSTDDTLEIAKRFNVKLHHNHDWPGFGRQRQLAQKLVSNDWMFMIDVDEQITPELRQSIEAVLDNPDAKKVYRFNRLTDFFGRFIKTSGWYPDRVARLYHKDHFCYNDAMVHERVECETSQLVDLDGHLLHFTTGSYREFLQKSIGYSADWADERFTKGKRTSVAGVVLRTLGMFLRKYLLQRGFMDGRHGFMLACVSSVYTFNKYAALWSLQQQSKQ